MLKDITTGLIYRNPKPHLRSIHAYFPSVSVMDNGKVLSTLVLGEAFSATNLRTFVARSTDDGEDWQLEGAVYPGTPDRLASDASRLTALAGGEMVLFMVRSGCSGHPDEGLANSQTAGVRPDRVAALAVPGLRAHLEPSGTTYSTAGRPPCHRLNNRAPLNLICEQH